MYLCFSPTSPYVRKVLMLAMEKGLESEINLVPMGTFTKESEIWQKNPLGKVPALETREGTILCDSPLICEYLESLNQSPALIPASGDARWKALNFHALADGIMDASLLRTMERRQRPSEHQLDSVHEAQKFKIDTTLDVFEQAIIDTVALYDVEAKRKDKAPGVYVDGAKIASLGLRIRKACSFHGLAFNIDMNLEPFQRINPCGFSGLEVIQLADLAENVQIEQVEQQLIDAFCQNFEKMEI